ncbi:hypothetical protein [Robbsia andropogonis]|uniref:hypothetical protein n=1 Tax=Robbsia andropogonis TaxID=28092 RepID=UPI0012FBE284|nr:hypothetical protein [Robbsia andropogonis]
MSEKTLLRRLQTTTGRVTKFSVEGIDIRFLNGLAWSDERQHNACFVSAGVKHLPARSGPVFTFIDKVNQRISHNCDSFALTSASAQASKAVLPPYLLMICNPAFVQPSHFPYVLPFFSKRMLLPTSIIESTT